MNAKNFIILLNKWHQATLSEAERIAFMTAVRSGQYDELLAEHFGQDLEMGLYAIQDGDQRMQQDWDRIAARMNTKPAAPVYRPHFLSTAWFRAAAVILLFAGIGTYLWLRPSSDSAETAQAESIPGKDKEVLPGSNKAILTLSDGKQVHINQSSHQTITDGSIAITNTNGTLSYKNVQIAAVNTMSTPKGGQYQLTLADGTKVWLNAESSITFPTAFSDNTREVSITGEVYFEVVRNKAKPFIVRTPKEMISVLGTSFNVNVYPDEPLSKFSLIEGSIKIGEQLLQPGQALINNKIITTNIQQDIAWKNGGFDFNDMDLASALRQLSRWYNIKIVYEGNVPQKKLWGGVGRDLNLSQVLTVLSNLGIKTKFSNNTLTIYPQ